jgi:hypothetical protein
MSKKSELKLVRDVEKWLQGKQGKYNKPIYTRRRKKGGKPHPTVCCPRCGSNYLKSRPANRYECCYCEHIFS